MRFLRHYGFFMILLLSIHANAQRPGGPGKGQSNGLTVVGMVIDQSSQAPIPYATVVALDKGSKEMIEGTSTNEDGKFRISITDPNIYLEVSFIGYEKQTVEEFEQREGRLLAGKIELAQSALELDVAEVEAERSRVEFKLDKRVFTVGKDISSTGMGAMEVLNNVPSVNVDIEGNITLRGNGGVQILINGKPSVLADEGGAALGTITADMIESVEVITNPSAKYEAEGTSGILNVVLKKEEKKGFNGSASINTGIPDNHSIGVSLNRRTENFNFFTQFGLGRRSLPTFSESINQNWITGTRIETDGLGYRNEEFFNITLGTDYYINPKNIITLSGNFAYEVEDQPSETNFRFYDGDDQLVSQWRRNESTSATNPKYQYDLQYKREFDNNEDHVLMLSTQGNFFGKSLNSIFNNTPILDSEVLPDQRTRTSFYKADYIFKADYTNPLTDEVTIETGALYEINDVGNDFEVANMVDGIFIPDSNLTNNFEFDQKVLGAYATGSYESDTWGVKLGMRVENTDLNTLLTNTGETNFQNYTNFFPSLHTTYKFSPLFSMQAGYSRRIFRPRLWDLNPFFNIRNNFNVSMGNPNLQPEFGDSYELTAIMIFEKLSLNSSIYYLYTTDVIERVSFFQDDVNVRMPVNLGTRQKTGFELNGKYKLGKSITFNGDFNYGIFSRDGNLDDQDFSFEASEWSTRLMTKFKLPANFDLEVTTNYRSDVQTVQGISRGFASADIGLRKKLWKGKAVVNVSMRDVFASRIRENIADQREFYLYSFSQRGRFITFGASYSFGKGEAMSYTGRRR